MPHLQPGELRWAALWTGPVLFLASLPYVIAWWLTPPGQVYTWVLSSPFDVFSYFAKIEEAIRGAWLLWVPHTPEPHNPAFLFPHYVLLGKLGALTGLTAPVLYHAFRVVAGGVLLLTAYWFLAAVTTQLAVRRTAFLFTALGGGLGWVTSLFGVVGIDATVPESNTFHTLLVNPHFALATALLLIIAMLVLHAAPRFPITRMGWAGALSVLAVVLQPFFVALMWCVAGAWAATVGLRRGLGSLAGPSRLLAFAWRPGLALPFAGFTLAGGLMWLNLQSNFATKGWIDQNFTPSPPVLNFLGAYGILAPLAVAGGVRAWRAPESAGLTRNGALLLLAWAVALPIMFYAPMQYQRRLSEGAHVPVSALAAGGLWWWAGRLGTERAWRLLRFGAMALLLMGTVWLAAFMLAGAQALRVPFYLPRQDVAALDWLAGNAAFGEVVIAAPIMGNLIPAWAPVRTYWGHGFETIDSANKLARTDRFFSPGDSPDARCQLLAEAGISYVYEGTLEKAKLGGTLAGQPGLQPAYQAAGVTIYRVTGCTAATSRS